MSPRIPLPLVLLTCLATAALAACAPQSAAAPEPTAAPPTATAPAPSATATQEPSPTAPPPTATAVPPTPTVPPPTATIAPTPQAEAGWLLHDDDTEGFSVALPDSWEHYKADRASLLKGFGSMRQQHPLLAGMYSDQSCECLHKAGWRLFAFDTAPESREDAYPATLVVYKFGGLYDPQLEDAVSLRIEQLMATEGVVQPVANDPVVSSAGDGARLWYLSNRYLDDTTNLPLYSVEYLVAKGGDLYYLVLTTSLDGQPHYAPLLDKILRSFKAIETGNLEGTV